MFQKMSTRDRSLLILLAAAVTFFLCYTYVITPQLANAEVLKGELLSIQSELERAEQLKGKTDELKKQEKLQRAELIKKYSNFFFDLNQSRLLNRVDAIHVGAGLPAQSYLATPETASQVLVEKGVYAPPQYPLKDMAAKINPDMAEAGSPDGQEGSVPAGNSQPSGEENPSGQEAVAASDMVLGTDVTVGFNGATYESIYNFIATVEKMNKTVVLKSINISKDETGLTGQLIFAFYSLPKLDPDQKDGLDYSPTIPAGKANPFI
jgi:Tfp pilus assembly protein PilO